MIQKFARLVIESTTIYAFFSGYRWYRKLHGGRWERWWIMPCQSALWLSINKNVPDNHRQPASEGPRIDREDY